MRRALNVLQACHAAYDVTGEAEIYTCTGAPQPADIETIVNSMLGDEFTTSYQSALNLTTVILTLTTRPCSDIKAKDRKGSCTSRYDFRSVRIHGDYRLWSASSYLPPRPTGSNRVSFTTHPSSALIVKFPDRHRLSTGGNEKIQLTALLGAFKNAVEIAAKNKK